MTLGSVRMVLSSSACSFCSMASSDGRHSRVANRRQRGRKIWGWNGPGPGRGLGAVEPAASCDAGSCWAKISCRLRREVRVQACTQYIRDAALQVVGLSAQGSRRELGSRGAQKRKVAGGCIVPHLPALRLTTGLASIGRLAAPVIGRLSSSLPSLVAKAQAGTKASDSKNRLP